MFTETTSFRPRNGECAESYWIVRRWCERHGYTLSDVLNALMIPLSFHLENHTEVDEEKGIAWVDLTIGMIPILHCLGGKLYVARADHPNIDEIEERVKYWRERNDKSPTHIDNYLRNITLKRA